MLINPIVQTYNVSYMGASSLPGACCLGMTIGMAFGPVLVSKAGLRKLTYIVSWVPAGCWLCMFAVMDFTVVIASNLIMARFLMKLFLNSISGLRGFEIFISDKNEYQEESLETFLMYVIDEMNAELGVIDSSEPVRSVSVKNYMSENLSKQWLGVLYTLCSSTASQCISIKIELLRPKLAPLELLLDSLLSLL